MRYLAEADEEDDVTALKRFRDNSLTTKKGQREEGRVVPLFCFVLYCFGLVWFLFIFSVDRLSFVCFLFLFFFYWDWYLFVVIVLFYFCVGGSFYLFSSFLLNFPIYIVFFCLFCSVSNGFLYLVPVLILGLLPGT